ncbi:MAG: DUF4352 domain-containing protein [Clostridia bacterium]|nr:DUF4352 domain-containing protein [Clostridia bacterium]
MKKFIALCLCLIFSFSFAACGSEDIPTKEQNEISSTKTTTKDTFGLNETAVFKDLKFTATEIKESDGDNFFTPEEGNVFVGVNFTVENVSEEEQAVSSILLFEAYADDVKCDYSISAACAFDGTLDGSIAPGKKIVGWYAVEVPENWNELELNVQSTWLSSKNATFKFTK